MATEQKNIKVVVRVRPYNKREMEHNQRCIVKVIDSTTLVFDPDEEDDEFFFQGTKQNYRDITKRVNKKLSMDFDRVFDTDASNMEVFEECTAPLVDSVLNGYNCSVFVYGATGAGKTFTMLGSNTSPGLTFLTMRDLFEKMEAQRAVRKFEIGVSYLEVYNEQVMNLLTKSGPLKLREDSNGVVVSGLALKPICSAEGLLELLTLGNSNRTQHPTDANAESSRSHAVFQVHIRMTELKTGTKRLVKLSMIDLAGSERAASTKGIGMRFKEGASINKSLLALGNCINKLADGLKHIPYRDSNLTRILKDSLGGNCQTLMVANVSMSSLTYEDTYNTLKYASRAKKIRTNLRQNAFKSNMPKEFYVKKVNELLAEVERLSEANKALEVKSTRSATSSSTSYGFDETELNEWYRKIDVLHSSLLKTQEHIIGIKSKIKNITFRAKLKADMEEFCKMLTNNDYDTQENCGRYNGSVCKLNKQIDKLKEELPSWRRKLHVIYKDLEQLKLEIKSTKYVNILQNYLKGKSFEVQHSKQCINNTHIAAINSELFVNAHKLRKAFTLSCEVLKSLHKSSLSAEQCSRYEELQRHLMDEINGLKENDSMTIGKHSCDDDDGESAISATETITNNNEMKLHASKRLRFEEYQLDDLDAMDGTDSDGGNSAENAFKMPAKKPRDFNETKVLSSIDEDCNATFHINSSSKSAALAMTSVKKSKAFSKPNLVASILSDQIVRAPANANQLRNVLLKSKKFTHNGLLKTVASGVQKENKKFSPNRVRKSPRTVVSKGFSGSSTTLVKRQAPHTVSGGNTDVPIVRINRAASFRVKK